MSEYTHPLADAEFVLSELVDFDSLCAGMGQEDINSELASVILSEAGKLGSGVWAPLNKVGDLQHPKMIEKDGGSGVQETAGFAQAYQEYVEGG